MTEWRDRLSRVLDNGGPEIVFQPIVNLWSETTVGYEALSRFPSVDSPEVWFAQADSEGLGDQLELAAIRNALADFEKHGLDGYVSVNASPGLLTRQNFADEIKCSKRVQIEVTESTPVGKYAEITRTLDAARRKGTTLAVDDVGAGYAAMRHVIYLAPDVLKLDRELVRGLHYTEETARRAVLGAYTYLAARLQLDLVAEGIERVDEVVALRALGVNYGQGYYFGKPIPARDIRRRRDRARHA